MVTVLLILLLFIVIELVRFFINFHKNEKIEKVWIQRKKEFQYLNFLTKDALNIKEPIDTKFTKYLNTLKETLNWTYHSIFRLDEDKQLLVIRFTGYLPDWYMQELATKVLIKTGDASVGRAVATKQPATINSTKSDPRFKSVTPLGPQTGYKSLSCYPIMGKLKTQGGFCTYSEFENIFTLHDTEFFLSFSNILGAILENELLEKYINP